MFRVARALARLMRAVSRRVGRSGGTTAPGRLLLKVSPRALERMSSELEAGSVLVSATNGKTTTAAMIAAALERSGRSVVHNRAGSNMAWGVATALLDAGREGGQLGLFEVDEAWLPTVARDTAPRLVLLSNLFRDQLDRYGELELLADRWAELTGELEGRARLVLNADDPLVADLGRERDRRDLLRSRGRLAGAARHAARGRLEALPQLRARLRVRGRLSRPHGALPLPELRPHAPRAAGGGHPGLARRHGGIAMSSCAPLRASSRCASRCRASTTSTTPSRPPRRRWSWVFRSQRSARRSRASAARSAASRRSRWTAAASRSS